MKSKRLLSLALTLAMVLSAAVTAPYASAAGAYPEAFEADDAAYAMIFFPQGYEESDGIVSFTAGGQLYCAYVAAGVDPFVESRFDGILWGRWLSPSLTLYKLEQRDEAYYWEFPGYVVAVVNAYFSGPAITIPETMFGKPVTKVYAQGAYRDRYDYRDENTTVTSVTLPDSVKYIGPGAFNNLKNLKSIKLPNNTDGLTVCAPFLSSDVIESVEFPGNVLLESRGYRWSPENTRDSGYIFEYCYNLSNITFGGSSAVLPFGQLVDLGHYRDGKQQRQYTEDDPFTITFRSSNPPVKFYFTDSSNVLSASAQLKSEMHMDATYTDSLPGFGVQSWENDTRYKTVVPRNCRKNYTGADDGNTADVYYFGLYVAEEGEVIVKAVSGLDTASAWARDYITKALGNGLIPDDLQDKYTQYITRGEFCRMAVQYIEAKTGLTVEDFAASRHVVIQTGVFTDTADPNILAASALGIVTGTGNNLFNPGGDITREQAAIMLMRLQTALAQDTAGAPAGFADSAKISSWAASGVNYVSAKGIMSGVGNNMFDPQGKYTREQAVITFVRLYELPYVEPEIGGSSIVSSGEYPLVEAWPMPAFRLNETEFSYENIQGVGGLELVFAGKKPSLNPSEISDVVLYVNGVKRDAVSWYLDTYTFYDEEWNQMHFILSLEGVVLEKPASFQFSFKYQGVQQTSTTLELQ